MRKKFRPKDYLPKENPLLTYFLKHEAKVFETEGEPNKLTLSQVQKTFALPPEKRDNHPENPIVVILDDSKSFFQSVQPQSVLLEEEFRGRYLKRRR